MQYVKLAREDIFSVYKHFVYKVLAREDIFSVYKHYVYSFLFASMTGTKVIQRIQVSTLLPGKFCAGTTGCFTIVETKRLGTNPGF